MYEMECNRMLKYTHTGGYEEDYLLGYNTLLATCVHVGFLLDLFFDLEDGGDMFLRNVG
jgi:hypothetical protein